MKFEEKGLKGKDENGIILPKNVSPKTQTQQTPRHRTRLAHRKHALTVSMPGGAMSLII